jgi:hypothetical protein
LGFIGLITITIAIIIIIIIKVKIKGVPLHVMEAHGARGGMAPTHT